MRNGCGPFAADIMKHLLPMLFWIFPEGKGLYKLAWKYGVLPPNSLIKLKITNQFRKRMGKRLNLEEPTTFNEKLQFIKLNLKHPMMPILSDKYRAREILAAKGLSGILVRLHGVYDKFDDIDFNALPDSFVMKVNHDSGGVFVIKDKTKANFKEVGKRITEKLKYPYIHGIINGEWQYLFISPKIIIEEYLEDESGDLLDYKIHCFEGHPEFIHVDIDRFRNHTRKFYNTQWQPMDFTNRCPRSDINVKRPHNLERMLEVAKVLSCEFHCCRVDFYEVQKKLYFSEVTFFHANGMGKFEPEEYDIKFGELIHL
jgi:hypothetical protein